MNVNNALLTLKNIVKYFDISGGLLEQLAIEKRRVIRKRAIVKAVNGVSFTVYPGETFSVVG